MKLLLNTLIISSLVHIMPSNAHAVSEAECAIWLCLPHGFGPSECGPSKSIYRKRIKKGKSPLPSWGSCFVSSGTDDKEGRYRIGRERWADCDAGYKPVYHLHPIMQKRIRSCVKESNCIDPRPDMLGEFRCESYIAKERKKQNFIEMWFGDEYAGKFYY